MDPQARRHLVTALAEKAGLASVGIAPAGPIPRADYFRQWLEADHHGRMDYLNRTRALRTDAGSLLPGARSIIVVADPYAPTADPSAHRPADTPRGRVARYAWGRDYHRVLRRKLQKLADRLHEAIAEPFATRVCVDTAPLIERESAAAAGLGWIGKNTMVIDRQRGSYFFLGAIVTTLEIETSTPVADHCGTCTRCLDACPTGALVAPYRMDARRCIAYLTIEHRTAIDRELQSKMGDWVFGCDICQEVCPHNRKTPPAGEPAYALNAANQDRAHPPLEPIARWTEQDRQRFVMGTALKRATLAMWQRNASIALANDRPSHQDRACPQDESSPDESSQGRSQVS